MRVQLAESRVLTYEKIVNDILRHKLLYNCHMVRNINFLGEVLLTLIPNFIGNLKNDCKLQYDLVLFTMVSLRFCNILVT